MKNVKRLLWFLTTYGIIIGILLVLAVVGFCTKNIGRGVSNIVFAVAVLIFVYQFIQQLMEVFDTAMSAKKAADTLIDLFLKKMKEVVENHDEEQNQPQDCECSKTNSRKKQENKE